MHAYIWIGIGTLFIAGGGLMATYGWNLKTSKEIKVSLEESRTHSLELKRKEIVKAVFLENTMNLFVINNKRFTETNKEELSKYAVYPRLRTEALTSALMSTLFLEKEHRLFFDSITRLLGYCNDFNNRVNRIERRMSRLTKHPEKMAESRIALRDGVFRDVMKKELIKFLNNVILSQQYEEFALSWIASELGKEEKAFIEKYLSQKNQN